MKVLVNGGLSCSSLDGWWDEAYEPQVGWAIGDRSAPGEATDAVDAEALYRLLEDRIVPEFYERAGGMPSAWVSRIRASMATLTPRYAVNRMMSEYVALYGPAAQAYHARARDCGRAGATLEAKLKDLARRWRGLAFGAVSMNRESGDLAVVAEVELADVRPEEVLVELYANAQKPECEPERHRFTLDSAGSPAQYRARIPTQRPAEDYTPRILPTVEGTSIPLEFSPILWQR